MDTWGYNDSVKMKTEAQSAQGKLEKVAKMESGRIALTEYKGHIRQIWYDIEYDEEAPLTMYAVDFDQ